MNCLRKDFVLVIQDLGFEKGAYRFSIHSAPGLVADNLIEPIKEETCILQLSFIAEKHRPHSIY